MDLLRRFAAETDAPWVDHLSSADRRLNTQEFAYIVHGEQPDQIPAPDDRDGMAIMALQALERDVDHV